MLKDIASTDLRILLLRRKASIVVAVAGAAVLVPGFTQQSPAMRAGGVLVFALLLWVSQVVDVTFTALAVLVLLPALGLLTLSRTLDGFAAPSAWLLVAVLMLSATTRASRLDARLAITLLRLTQGRAKAAVAAVVAVLLALLFVIPTSSGRASISTPVVLGLVRALRLEPGSALGKVFFLVIPFVSVVSSTAILTGAVAAIYTNEFLLASTGHALTWTWWMLAAFPGAITTSLLVGPFLWMVFRPSATSLAPLNEYLADARASLGPMSMRERRLATLLVVLIAGFTLSSTIHVPIELITLGVAVAALAPVIGVVTWAEIRNDIPWDVIILYGAGLAMSLSLAETHAFDGLLKLAAPVMRPLDPALVAVITMVTLALVRLAFTSVVAMVAAVLPFMLSLAVTLDFNPIWLGLVVVVAADLCIGLPTQSVAGVIAYSAGYFSVRDMALAAIPVSACLISVTVLLARFYWPLIGIPIFSVSSP